MSRITTGIEGGARGRVARTLEAEVLRLHRGARCGRRLRRARHLAASARQTETHLRCRPLVVCPPRAPSGPSYRTSRVSVVVGARAAWRSAGRLVGGSSFLWTLLFAHATGAASVSAHIYTNLHTVYRSASNSVVVAVREQDSADRLDPRCGRHHQVALRGLEVDDPRALHQLRDPAGGGQTLPVAIHGDQPHTPRTHTRACTSWSLRGRCPAERQAAAPCSSPCSACSARWCR